MIVDASAAVEYLLQSTLGLRVTTLMGAADVAAPELLDVELLSVLRREVLHGGLDLRRAEEAIDDLADQGLERIGHRNLLRGAWQLRGHVTAYDALYVEAARQTGVALVTADGPLARATGLGITVHNVRVSEPAQKHQVVITVSGPYCYQNPHSSNIFAYLGDLRPAAR